MIDQDLNICIRSLLFYFSDKVSSNHLKSKISTGYSLEMQLVKNLACNIFKSKFYKMWRKETYLLIIIIVERNRNKLTF